MRTKKLSKTAILILKVLVQFVLLLCLLIWLDYVYLTNIRPDILANERFQQTECFVMSKKLSSKGKYYHRYRADFLINYHANGAQYNRWVTGNGLDMTYTANNVSQEQMLSNFENGTNYTCWYDPDNAERVMLVRRERWFSLHTFILPAVAAFITAICFFVNGVRLLKTMSKKYFRDIT